jgi:glycosyltransferase involved in cell wall biosynthesis
MCSSLAANGWEVSLVVADGKGDENKNSVYIYDVGSSKDRLNRMFNAPNRVYTKALELNADIYHLHDPELIPIGLKLKKHGKRVIFDSHEDIPRQILSKPYLNKYILCIISKIYRLFEILTCRRLDGIVVANPPTVANFSFINKRTVNINNYPKIDELAPCQDWNNKNAEVCYVGDISRIRGVVEICEAIALSKTDVRLNLCGHFTDTGFESLVKSTSGWNRVNALGYVDRDTLKKILTQSIAGLVTQYPVPNFLINLPVKLFEYMCAGIPAIVSNSDMLSEIVNGAQCGLLVDPFRPDQIAEAIDYLVTHPDEARRMGENGRKAVVERYNWHIEEQKLLNFYDDLLRT